jgi:GNAT superfamily N-acetyltransferase
LIEIRSLSLDDVRAGSIFPAVFRSSRILRVGRSGRAPELTWKLRLVGQPVEMVRRLGGGTIDSMVELYGPAQELRFVGAFEDGTLIGMLTWKYETWNRMVWLCDIRVREEHRRKGLGARLLEDLKWAAMRQDARGIMLETQNTNAPAVEFYLKEGFRLIGLNSELYGLPDRGPAEIALFFYLSLGD